MAADAALLDVLSNFTTATNAALQGLPEVTSLLPPDNGITLLDAKSEIFLAYLQALALRNLNVIRSIKHGSDAKTTHALSEELTKKLVEHRVYLERGVRPLEQKIKYQVDKVVKAADDQARATAQKAKIVPVTNSSKGKGFEDEESDEDESEDDEDSAADDGEAALAHRPSRAVFSRPVNADANGERRAQSKQDGVYRPPRISATAMPTTDTVRDKKERERRPARSGVVEDYIESEYATAPMAEPSIGSTIAAGGRSTKSRKQVEDEAKRRDYEETNLVRLPKQSKKDQLKSSGGRERGGGFGGEEWRGLGESVDRIGDVTRRKGKESALDRSRKRRAVADGPRGSGSGIGDAFDVKRRRMEKKTRR